MSSWRLVLLEACPPGGLSAGEMTANLHVLCIMFTTSLIRNAPIDIQLGLVARLDNFVPLLLLNPYRNTNYDASD